MICNACAKKAIFETQRVDVTASVPRQWCLGHLTEKVTKYPLTVKRLRRGE